MEVNEKKDIKSMGTRQRDLSEFMNFFEWGVHISLAFFVILLLGIMTTVWGNIPKAQDDAETIEEAIARLIAIHEAEPTSHTGDGEAIDVHRKNDIVDHPQGSILADKLTSREVLYDLSVGAGASFTNTGLVTTTGLRLFELSTEDGGTQTSQAKALTYPGFNPFANTKDSLIETQVYFDLSGENIQDIWFGITDGTTPGNTGYGFKWDGTQVRGFARFGSTTYYTSALTVTSRTLGIFRAQYNTIENTVYFYYNGELVGSLTNATYDLTAGTYFVFKLIGNNDAGSVCSFYRLYASGSA